MGAIQEPMNLGDLLKFEFPNLYSREVQTTTAGSEDIALGTVMGRVTASGEVLPWQPGATDGSEQVYGVAIAALGALSRPGPLLMVVRNAIVADTALVWPTGMTVAERVSGIDQLNRRGIILRRGV